MFDELCLEATSMSRDWSRVFVGVGCRLPSLKAVSDSCTWADDWSVVLFAVPLFMALCLRAASNSSKEAFAWSRALVAVSSIALCLGCMSTSSFFAADFVGVEAERARGQPEPWCGPGAMTLRKHRRVIAHTCTHR